MTFKETTNSVKAFFARIGKKNLVIIGAVMLIGVAVLLNWVLLSDKDGDGYTYNDGSGMVGELDNSKNPTSGEEGTSGSSVGSDSYFSSVQVSRQRARDEALEVLQAVVNNANATDEVKAEAVAEITQISLEMKQE